MSFLLQTRKPTRSTAQNSDISTCVRMLTACLTFQQCIRPKLHFQQCLSFVRCCRFTIEKCSMQLILFSFHPRKRNTPGKSFTFWKRPAFRIALTSRQNICMQGYMEKHWLFPTVQVNAGHQWRNLKFASWGAKLSWRGHLATVGEPIRKHTKKKVKKLWIQMPWMSIPGKNTQTPQKTQKTTYWKSKNY